MYKSKPVNVVCAALFIGILLSCAFYFGITALLDTEEKTGGTSEEYGISFMDFSDAFYDSENLSTFVGRCEYLIFKSVGSNDIILGDKDFLFGAGTTEAGYNYLEDYLGIGQFTGIELILLQNYIKLRQLSYKNQGAEYLLVVIPNSQTVYSEYMPSYIGPISGSTRLSQLTAYLNDVGCNYFYNATDALIAAKTQAKTQYDIDQLYNNTENSLNSLGEWYIYSAVCDKLNELYKINGDRVGIDALKLYRNFTEGKELAKSAGLSEIIKNQTISLSDSTKIRYTSDDLYGRMVKTIINSNGGSPKVLLEFTDEWDRTQLMPYFSNTFNEVAYKPNHQFSSLVVDGVNPDVVVQFIHEYELYDIADPDLSQTYSAGKNIEIKQDETAEPIIVAQCQTGSTTVCISGQTESGALITVSGDNIKTVSQSAIGSLFFIEVDLGNTMTTTVNLTAKVNGKAESKTVPLTIRRNDTVKDLTVAVGSNSQLYSNDYSGLELLTDKEAEAVRTSMAEKIANTRKLSGKNTEFIYVIVPDKLAVLSEDAPASLTSLAETIETFKKKVNSVLTSAGMTVLDLTQEMIDHKVLGQLYYQTDTLWTDIGAYVGYFTLMDQAIKVKPHTLNEFKPNAEEDIGGELVTRLGLDNIIISERLETLRPDFAPSYHSEQSDIYFDIRKAYITYNNKSDLPVAIVMRDEYGTSILGNMAEHFSKMAVQSEGMFTFSDDLITMLQPDYVIIIRCNGELS